ncbi:MAG TPA: hypothetical protein VHC22_17930 [Pirellulales bacterium]|nr:hypothetical protein [Pirellulales bacterium]
MADEVIERRLEVLAKGMSNEPAWLATLKKRPWKQSTEEYLSFCAGLLESGDIPNEAALFMIGNAVIPIGHERLERWLAEIHEDVYEVWEKYGLEHILSSDTRISLDDVLESAPEIGDDIFVQLLLHYGERPSAELFRRDREEYQRIFEAGYGFFIPKKECPQENRPSEPPAEKVAPDWLGELAGRIVGCFTSPTAPPDVGLYSSSGNHHFSVIIRPKVTVATSGPEDGNDVLHPFSFSAKQLMDVFDSVDQFSCDAFAESFDDDDPNVARIDPLANPLDRVPRECDGVFSAVELDRGPSAAEEERAARSLRLQQGRELEQDVMVPVRNLDVIVGHQTTAGRLGDAIQYPGPKAEEKPYPTNLLFVRRHARRKQAAVHKTERGPGAVLSNPPVELPLER